MQNDNKYLRFKKAFRELQADMDKFNTVTFTESERELWEMMMGKIKVFLLEIEMNIYSIADDLKKTRQELKKSSNKLLDQASEQLDKVTKSTQKVAESVINRIDNITVKQKIVSGHLKEIKKKVMTLDSDVMARAVVESADIIEKAESEIQTEAFEIMSEMQFQDITAQQIQQVIHLIGETEAKLRDFGQVLSQLNDGKNLQPQGAAGRLDFDPNATLDDREKRQNLADEITNSFNKAI